MEKRLDLKGWAFLPFIVFLILYVGSGLLFTYWKVPQPFDQFSRFSALLFAISVGLFMAPNIPLSKKADVFSKHAGASGVMMIVLIYLLAGAFQSTTQFIGGKQSLVNLGLTYIPDVLLVPGIFLLSCGISTAIGTSMGTIAAIGPVAASVAQGAGLSLPMTCAAVIGGA
ncbi:Na+/H+ antiporter NhaC family protein [[Eubacterium] hominis]|uniref:Na+/H+ antiporter NhaC family protein n=1 Tax=[Eubacterium] hominis TaxID=2764325 RepID=UPI003A4DCA91